MEGGVPAVPAPLRVAVLLLGVARTHWACTRRVRQPADAGAAAGARMHKPAVLCRMSGCMPAACSCSLLLLALVFLPARTMHARAIVRVHACTCVYLFSQCCELPAARTPFRQLPPLLRVPPMDRV